MTPELVVVILAVIAVIGLLAVIIVLAFSNKPKEPQKFHLPPLVTVVETDNIESNVFDDIVVIVVQVNGRKRGE